MSFLDTDKISLGDEEFRLLSGFIYGYCGLHFNPSTKFLMETRLQNRLRTHRFDSFLQYYHYLLFHQDRQAEINEMVDVLTTNETYFFREKRQLDAFAEEILPELVKVKERTRNILIWSAGCSTGEEPYTLAMLVDESRLFSGWKVEIVGTDISQRVLRTARKAVYMPSSFRMTEERWIQRYFSRTEDGKLQLDERIRSMVQFGHLNLMDEKMMGLIRECDLVMCRNVIIYFDQEAKAKVINFFHRKLRPGGYLLLGHSESLMNITTAFRLKHLVRDLVYQKSEDIR